MPTCGILGTCQYLHGILSATQFSQFYTAGKNRTSIKLMVEDIVTFLGKSTVENYDFPHTLLNKLGPLDLASILLILKCSNVAAAASTVILATVDTSKNLKQPQVVNKVISAKTKQTSTSAQAKNTTQTWASTAKSAATTKT